MADQPVQPMALSQLEFSDFKGGMTDYYLGAAIQRFQRGDNLVLVKYGEKAKPYTRPGSEIYDAVNYQIPLGNARISCLKAFEGFLFFQSGRHLYYIDEGAWQEVLGPTGNLPFPASTDDSSTLAIGTWNGHMLMVADFYGSPGFQSLPLKIIRTGGVYYSLTAGLPALATNPTVTAGGAGAQNYLYRFIYRTDYTASSGAFIDRGPAVEVAVTLTLAPNVTPIAITAIPPLANGTTTNYDTANTTIEIYRTTTGGQNFFLVGSVANGTTIYNDSMIDSTLQNQEPLYTESGAPDNDPPPVSAALHVVDDKGYYGNVYGAPNKVFQSIPGDIDSVPETFFVTLQDSVVAISSVISSPIVLCSTSIVRLDGGFDELGGGFITPTKISDTAGCISQQSVVQTLFGIFWAGNDGFYFSDRLSVQKISDGLNETYAAILALDDGTGLLNRLITGRYDRKHKRVYWTVRKEDNATDTDTIFILDLNYGISNDMPFTTLSGGADNPTNFAPTAIEIVDGNLVRGDVRGYAFQHDDGLYTDPKIDVLSLPSVWEVATILYDFISVATDFGTTAARKWVPSVDVICKNQTDLSLQIISVNDDGRRTAPLKPIRFRGNTVWGDPDVYWGDPGVTWGSLGVIDDTRRFPAGGLRCEYKQVRFTNAHVAILSSDVLGTCAVNATLKTATLTDPVTYAWPDASVDYYLSFAGDGYVKEFLIIARTDSTLTYLDALGQTATLSGVKWVIRGKPKGEIMYLINFVVNYAVFGDTQPAFHKTGTGEVGASDA